MPANAGRMENFMVKVITDSTCDLSDELLKRYDIEMLPLYIRMGDDEYKDRVNTTPEEIYKWSDANHLTPQTAAASIDDCKKILEPHMQAGDDVVMITISSDMSTTINVVKIAAEELDYEDHVYVIDSMNLSTGVGLLVIEAAIMAKEGKTPEEIVSVIEALRPYVRASFVVDTLTFLHRGGRCSATAALVGSLLKIKPRIFVKDGKMDAGKKYRGPLDKVIVQYVKDMESSLKNARPDRVFITHSGCDSEIVEKVKAYLQELNIFDEILETRAGGVISSHCGPGTLGVLFIEKEKTFGPFDSVFDANGNGIMEENEKQEERAYIRHLAENENEFEEQEEE